MHLKALLFKLVILKKLYMYSLLCGVYAVLYCCLWCVWLYKMACLAVPYFFTFKEAQFLENKLLNMQGVF